jgi:membrane protease YdiL (CAAX protease family)
VPARLRWIAVGLATPMRGRLWLAGQVVMEEAMWRGCLLSLLAAGLGIPVAVAVSSVAFGVWHLQQGWQGVLANTVNGLTFAVSFLLLDGLAAAVLTHAAHNFILAAMLTGQQRKGVRRAFA